NTDELKNLRKKSNAIIGFCSVIMLIASFLLAEPLSQMFVGYDKELFDMTVRGFYIFSFSFLFAGFAIFGSGFFTALNDGLTSAIISFLRTLVFQIAAVLLLPLVLGLDGIWISVVAAEAAAVALTFLFIKLKKKKYHY
ncbi:MAG: MATE family efflux transporter, partial [Clostridia bacterium]|nr:MATE family efflux transporter [Clostridia bacterium]